MSENNQNNQNNFLHPLIDLIAKIKSGEGKVEGDDFRRIAEDETLTENLRLLVYFAADLLDQRGEWGYDTLTGFYNCSRIQETLEGAFRRYIRHPEDRLTVVLFDLDRLGDANRMGEGHKGGDKMISNFAFLLKKIYSSKTDMLGRWKVGDEFIVVMRGGKELAESLTQKLENKLEQTEVLINKKPLKMSASRVIHELNTTKKLEYQIDQMSRELLEIKAKNGKDEKKNKELKAIEEMEERKKKRERKRKRPMPKSGKNVFEIKKLKEKREEDYT